MNIDINRDVAVGFDEYGKPLNCWGDTVPWYPGKGLYVSGELMDALCQAQQELEDEDDV